MIPRGRAIGWSGLAGAAIVAAVAPAIVQLGFAVLAIGVVGMAHGASDLAIVPPPRRAAFLAAYLLVSALCLVWWVADPAVALPLFLIASAIHFGVEDAQGGGWGEGAARGISLIATPAALHAREYAAILRYAGGDLPAAVPLALGVAGACAAAALLVIAGKRHDRTLAAGTLALLLLPPLVGFSLGFLILHALPQTEARRVQLACPSYASYLRSVAPILGLAIALAGIVGMLLLRWDATGTRSLFAGIAALAMPHLLVTPWFETHRPAAALAYG